jgi:hypothetical protein
VGAEEAGLDPAAPPSDPVPAPTPGAPKRRLSGRARLAGGSAVLLLLLGVVALWRIGGSSTPTYPTAWDHRVTGIVDFVEKQRGLLFEHPVAVRFLPDAQFNRKVAVPQPTSKSDQAELDRALGELRALGLVHGKVDLASSLNTLTQSGVVGLYVNRDKTVYVRGSAMTPFVRVTLAHELTHALQDQHWDISKMEKAAPAGDDTALRALLEGDAVTVQNAYEKTLSPADEQTYQHEQSAAQDRSSRASANVPGVLSDLMSFPYAFGPPYIDALTANGNTTALEDAFNHPPVAEAQIIDPASYPTSWRPARVAVPTLPAGDHRVDPPQSFGQFSLFEVLSSRLGYTAAWAAVQGWQGDNSVPYADHGRTCMAVDVRFAGPGDASRFYGATRQWAATIPGATATISGALTRIRSCDPGAAAASPPPPNPSPFETLVARAQIIDALTKDSVHYALGACVADHMISVLGPAGLQTLDRSDSLSAAQEANLQHLASQSALQCQEAGIS